MRKGTCKTGDPNGTPDPSVRIPLDSERFACVFPSFCSEETLSESGLSALPGQDRYFPCLLIFSQFNDMQVNDLSGSSSGFEVFLPVLV